MGLERHGREKERINHHQKTLHFLLACGKMNLHPLGGRK